MRLPDSPRLFPGFGQSGFTLAEAVIVIAVTGIIAAVAAAFIHAPVQGYFDASRRAGITDIADTALRRMARDLRLALPNSVRVAGNQQAVEFLMTRTGGRYRAERGSTGDNHLDFTEAGPADVDTSFEVLGPPLTLQAGDQLVIYNLGIPGADAYEGNDGPTHVRREITSTGSTTTVAFRSSHPLPFESPGHGFQVVEGPVSYFCDPASRTLRRYWGYPIQPNQAGTAADLEALAGGSGGRAVLAHNVSDCLFSYEPGITERNGLMVMRITMGEGGENVTLYHEVHVSNVP